MKTKMVEHELKSENGSRLFVGLWKLQAVVTLWKLQDKMYAILAAVMRKRMTRGLWGWSVHMGKFLFTQVNANRDLGNRASLASHMNTSKCLRRKERLGRSQKQNQPG